MAQPGNQVVNLSASGTGVIVGDGTLRGIFVTTSTSLTLKLYDNVSGQSGTVLLPTTAALSVGWYPFPATFTSGISVTIGGTGTFTLVYSRGA